MVKELKSMVGEKSGHLTVIAESDERLYGTNRLWECLCECGNIILVPTSTLTKRAKKSCGCVSLTELRGTHGKYGTSTHKTWRSMVDRCTKPGGRGYQQYSHLDVCEKWMTFEGFYEEMGDRPDGMTLDRIDCNLGYFKENCRWADLVTQQQNRRPNYINKNKGLAGVFKSGNRFVARIGHSGKKEYIGIYDTPEEANDAYNARGLELFGELWVYKGEKPSKEGVDCD